MENSHWISVEDELPEAGKGVLVYAVQAKQGCKMTVGVFVPELCGFHTDDEALIDVTHWQPLPQPPQTIKTSKP